VLGAALGLLVGFAGGGAAGLLDLAARADPVPQRSPVPVPFAYKTPADRLGPAVAPKAPASSVLGSILKGPSKASSTCGDQGARLVRFRVIVESGLATTPGRFANDVLKVLCDRRSWIGSGKVRFRYDPNGPLLVGLRTADTTERRCMALIHLSVNRYYSCATLSEVVLNADRWFGGSKSWPGSVTAYRAMLVNHEVGHALGQHHRGCPTEGNPAPVMMQQSKGMTTSGRTCRPNAWPLGYEKRSLR
jgi:hypothetical protein